jgi:GNAT superfamily N-acetyltransferase
MALIFAVETFEQAYHDISTLALTTAHAAEVARGIHPISIDYNQFNWMDKNGQLQVVTVRDCGVLCGYHITMIRPHMHRAVLAGFVDTLYLAPEHRGRTSMRMIQYAEDMMRRRGVKWISTGVRTTKDFGRLMEHLGYTEAERLYRKEFV